MTGDPDFSQRSWENRRVETRCPVHPKKRARRRCYLCRRRFCARCEYSAEHHLFCGISCARLYQKQRARERWSSRLAAPVSPRLAYPLLALLLASAAAASLRIADGLARLEPMPPRLPRLAASGAVRISGVVPAGAGRFQVSGSAPEGAGVLLFSGDRFVAVTTARGGAFRFDDVDAAGPFRVGALPLSEAISPRSPGPAPPPEPRGLAAPDVLHGPGGTLAGGKKILVSFDAGSSDRGAEEILAALRQRSIRTTIFLTGSFIARFPEIVREIARDGHEVGNHTFDHPHLTTFAENGRQETLPGVTEAFLRSELDRTRRLYENLTGARMAPLWRAPYGEENPEIRLWAERDGYTHVSWTHGPGGSLDSLDWVSDPSSRRYRSSERVVERLLAMARPGGIMLLHLGTDRQEDAVAPRLPELLDALSARGYAFARATDFLAGTPR
jgi:peptidoglycan/xylan/chitin deacetylase (PgdA/CDA1 family)